jgi:hypothetical protein
MKLAWLALVGACGFSAQSINAGDASSADTSDGPLALDAAIPVRMVQQKQNINSGSHSTVAATFDVPQGQGDLIVVVLSWGGNMTGAVVNDNSGNTYAPLHGVIAGGGVGQASFYAENIHAASANVVSVTLSANENNIAIRMIEYAGIATSGSLDAASLATGNSTTSDSGPLVTTHAHELLVGASTNAGNADGPGSGWNQEVIYAGDILEDREVTSLGTYDATAMMPMQAWIMLIAGFRAAS